MEVQSAIHSYSTDSTEKEKFLLKKSKILKNMYKNVLFNIVENRHIAANTDGVKIVKVNGLELMFNMGKSGI